MTKSDFLGAWNLAVSHFQSNRDYNKTLSEADFAIECGQMLHILNPGRISEIEEGVIRDTILLAGSMVQIDSVFAVMRTIQLSEQAWEAYQKVSSVCRFAWGEGLVCQRDKGHTGKHYVERKDAKGAVTECFESE